MGLRADTARIGQQAFSFYPQSSSGSDDPVGLGVSEFPAIDPYAMQKQVWPTSAVQMPRYIKRRFKNFASPTQRGSPRKNVLEV